MKKIITTILLSAIMIFCGCGAATTDKPTGSASAGHETAAASTASPVVTQPASDTLPSASAGIVIPPETKVYAAEGELAGVKPLFESYLKGNDMLAFAVSTVFKGDAYLMGFIYENNEDTLPFNRVIGLKQNGTSIEEAFISDNYKNHKGGEPVNFVQFQDEMFYDTQTLETSGMLIIKTNEFSSEDAGYHNFFLINERGLLDNHINTNLTEPCELYEYNDKLLLNESYTWYAFTVKDEKIVLNEITDFEPYLPEINDDDFVINLKDFKPCTYDESKGEYKDDSYIEVGIDESNVLTGEDFSIEFDDDGCGPIPVYLSKEKFKIKAGTRIVLLYPPGMEADCSISGDMDDSGFEYLYLPGVVVLRAQEPGEYSAQIENYDACLIYITAE